MDKLKVVALDDRGTMKNPISKLFVWVCRNDQGNEGIVTQNGLPLVFTDPELIRKTQPVIDALRKNGFDIRLATFLETQ